MDNKRQYSNPSLDTMTTATTICSSSSSSSLSSLSSLSRLNSFNNHYHYKNRQPSITSLQAKLYFLKILSELPCYGAKMFITTRKLMMNNNNNNNMVEHYNVNENNNINNNNNNSDNNVNIVNMNSKRHTNDELIKKKNLNIGNIKYMKRNQSATTTVMNEKIIIINPKFGISHMNNNHLNPVSYPQTIMKLEDIQSIRVTHNDQTLLNDVEIYANHTTLEM
ncbi:hypothetical protein DERF_010091 [Dermatophagoides farinae]|uniref:Uncharacterized protein n=1 Tax=Dermatophagoides farinae TaxID=6954 RepID=A0A922L6G8_DERFA|nr:hypothetical protein DERF_010091 [Dermatophagoides farinae]